VKKLFVVALAGFVLGLLIAGLSIPILNQMLKDTERPRPAQWYDSIIFLSSPGFLLASDPPNGVENEVGDGVADDLRPYILLWNGLAWSLGFVFFSFLLSKAKLLKTRLSHAR
jgi:hypothetical protein